NTNHMAVFDFKGHTYFVYHDGSLPHGSGFRRVACCEEFKVNEDGTIPYIKKTAVGLTGTVSKLYDYYKNPIYVKEFENTLSDSDYPMTGKEVGCDSAFDGENAEWEINPGKLDKKNEALVSLESNYKPGMYLSVGKALADGSYNMVLSQDVKGTTEEAKAMTFRTIKGLNGKGVTFESALYHGYYIASVGGKLILTESPDKNAASFSTEKIAEGGTLAAEVITKAKVRKSVRMYAVGDTVAANDIRIRATLDNGKKVTIKDGIKLEVGADVTATTGKKELKVTYSYMGNEYEATVVINVVDKEYKN
ncbi:MAG: bacterial Ig-like domain-containing protein, partial [Pseudobutyrivibrio sp.]|nr:bacterial Ig-like domain-containing protein [Pseudobutyrivibrio sp.]